MVTRPMKKLTLTADARLIEACLLYTSDAADE